MDESMNGGTMARDFVRDTLRYPFIVWTRWASAAGRSKEPRYYGFVLIGTNASLDTRVGAKLIFGVASAGVIRLGWLIHTRVQLRPL